MWRLSFILHKQFSKSRVQVHDKGVSNDDEYHAYVTPIPRSILRSKCTINCMWTRFQSSLRGLLNEIILRWPFTRRDSLSIPLWNGNTLMRRFSNMQL